MDRSTWTRGGWNVGRLVLAAFVVEALLAGGNGIAVRFSNRELPPLWGASLRFWLAALLLASLMIGLKLALPRGRALVGSLIYGLLQFAGAFGLMYYALVNVQAGLGQTLLALVPLAALLLAVAQRQERLRAASVVGALLGLAGVALMSLGPLGQQIPLLSLLAILGSVLCFGQALVVVRRFPPVHPVAMNAVGMAASAVVLLGASVLFGEVREVPRLTSTWVALGYVSAIGSVVVFLLYVYVVQRWSASRASYVMVLIPFVTVALSAWLDKEPITSGLVFGGALVLAGVYFGALRPSKALRPAHPAPAS
ncbi:MAG: DMT family transporter [Trueperaceae bacterium]